MTEQTYKVEITSRRNEDAFAVEEWTIKVREIGTPRYKATRNEIFREITRQVSTESYGKGITVVYSEANRGKKFSFRVERSN